MTKETTCDDFLGGALQLEQPRDGYRAGIDPVLLAAATPAKSGESVLELGCGAGAALLCLGRRVEGLELTGLELQPLYADIARRNAARNALEAEIVEADLRDMPAWMRQRSWDHVIMNPPYFDRQHSSAAKDAGRDIALGGDTPLSDWIDCAAKRLAPKGHLSLIQRIERLPEVLAACDGRVGSIIVKPIQPRQNRDVTLFLMQARKGGRAAFRLAVPLILHRGIEHVTDGDDYTDEVAAILRNGSALPFTR